MFFYVNLFQVKVGYESVEVACEHLSQYIEKSAFEDQIILLPEVWVSGFNPKQLFKYSEEHQIMLSNLKKIAIDNRVTLACTLPMPSLIEDEKLINNFLFISKHGSILSSYQKMHLFPETDEKLYFQAGEKPELVSFNGIKIGFAICYDIRFPELFRYYALAGAQVVFVSACFPKPRLFHWLTLLKARAIENQIFIVAVNGVGADNLDDRKIEYFGHSIAIDPFGNVIAELNEEESTGLVKIDVDLIREARKSVNFLKDIRYDYY